MWQDILDSMSDALTTSLTGLAGGFPEFLGGLIILLVGLIVAGLVKRGLDALFGVLKVDKWGEKAKLTKGASVRVWQKLIGEIARWAVIVLFLVPALATWGVPGISDLLSDLLAYLPNVFVAAVIGFIGIVVADLTEGVIRQGFKGIGAVSAQVMAGVSRYAILFFTALVVLNQLGVAANLVQVLFTGVVAMLALAGGLAFGLGGQETARDILEAIRKRLS
ncbi:hypothetical protein GTO10_01605 [Candidatus Saccharibacteria bacterium]|nr:hypothetical protein [Candidatus Saccharibacteria bacterium]